MRLGLDSIYRQYFVSGMEMYKMYDRMCQALEGIAEVLNCPSSARGYFVFRGNSICDMQVRTRLIRLSPNLFYGCLTAS